MERTSPVAPAVAARLVAAPRADQASVSGATYWADALFGGKTAVVVDDLGLTVFEIAKERLPALSASPANDPAALSQHAEKEKRIPFERMEKVKKGFKSPSLTITVDGTEYDVNLPPLADPFVFDTIKSRAPGLVEGAEAASMAACGPGCGLILVGVLGTPLYLAARQAAAEPPGYVYTGSGYRAGRQRALHDLVKALGPEGTLGIVLTLATIAVLMIVVRLVKPPSVKVLQRP
jgi:hypothetical protein